MEARVATEELMDRRTFMDLAVVEQSDHVAAQMPQDVLEKRADHFAINVRVEQLTVQPEVAVNRADRNSRDGRNPVVPVGVPVNGRLTSWTPRLAHRRDQEKARFVEEKQMGPQPRGVFFRRGHTSRFHWAMASSSRSKARRSGFWWLHPRSCRSLPT